MWIAKIGMIVFSVVLFILVTHNHSDHNRIDLCAKKENCKIIRWDDALTDGEYQVFEEGNIRIEAVPSGGNASHSMNNNVGYIVTVDGVSVYHGYKSKEIISGQY